MDSQPWDLVPAFSPDRLIALSRRLLEIREEVHQAVDPAKGDNGWVVGVMAYQRSRYQLSADAASGQFPWLTASAPPYLQFDVKIGGVVLHIFRGDSNDPDARQVLRGLEKAQLALFENGADGDDTWGNYLTVETDRDGRGLQVVFFQANAANEVRHRWVVPTDESITSRPTAATLRLQPGPELPPPVVRPRRARAASDEGGA
jgi:hypothetical protein